MKDGDLSALTDPLAIQTIGQSVDPLRERPVGESGPLADNRLLLLEEFDGLRQGLSQDHGLPPTVGPSRKDPKTPFLWDYRLNSNNMVGLTRLTDLLMASEERLSRPNLSIHSIPSGVDQNLPF